MGDGWIDKAIEQGLGGKHMRSGDVALRLSTVFVVAGSIALAAGMYELDRREKSSSETIAANLNTLDQRLEFLTNQVRILNDEFSSQRNASELQIQALDSQVQALESRLRAVEDHKPAIAPR